MQIVLSFVHDNAAVVQISEHQVDQMNNDEQLEIARERVRRRRSRRELQPNHCIPTQQFCANVTVFQTRNLFKTFAVSHTVTAYEHGGRCHNQSIDEALRKK
jgi:hypothetical protein